MNLKNHRGTEHIEKKPGVARQHHPLVERQYANKVYEFSLCLCVSVVRDLE